MDNTKLYEEQILPLLQQIKDIADANKIPFFAIFQTAQTLNEKNQWDCMVQGVRNINKPTRPEFVHPHIVLASIATTIQSGMAEALCHQFAPALMKSLIEDENNARKTKH